MNEQHHEMILEKSHASGPEEWYCPTCGRRILLRVPPTNEMVIVELGDKFASHWGSNGSLRIGTAQEAQLDGEREEISEESLRPWIKALEDLDLNW